MDSGGLPVHVSVSWPTADVRLRFVGAVTADGNSRDTVGLVLAPPSEPLVLTL